MCGAGHCVGTLEDDMLRTACVYDIKAQSRQVQSILASFLTSCHLSDLSLIQNNMDTSLKSPFLDLNVQTKKYEQLNGGLPGRLKQTRNFWSVHKEKSLNWPI